MACHSHGRGKYFLARPVARRAQPLGLHQSRHRSGREARARRLWAGRCSSTGCVSSFSNAGPSRSGRLPTAGRASGRARVVDQSRTETARPVGAELRLVHRRGAFRPRQRPRPGRRVFALSGACGDQGIRRSRVARYSRSYGLRDARLTPHKSPVRRFDARGGPPQPARARLRPGASSSRSGSGARPPANRSVTRENSASSRFVVSGPLARLPSRLPRRTPARQ